jgi:hypothetical protein
MNARPFREPNHIHSCQFLYWGRAFDLKNDSLPRLGFNKRGTKHFSLPIVINRLPRRLSAHICSSSFMQKVSLTSWKVSGGVDNLEISC